METEQQPEQQPSTRRLLELQALAEKAEAEAPSGAFAAAAPPAPFLFASSPSTSISLAEAEKQNVQPQSTVAGSVYEGKKKSVVALVVAAANNALRALSTSQPLSLSTPHRNPSPPPPHPHVDTAISKNREYSDLKQLVDKAGLASELGPSFSGTVLAPVIHRLFFRRSFSFFPLPLLALTQLLLFLRPRVYLKTANPEQRRVRPGRPRRRPQGLRLPRRQPSGPQEAPLLPPPPAEGPAERPHRRPVAPHSPAGGPDQGRPRARRRRRDRAGLVQRGRCGPRGTRSVDSFSFFLFRLLFFFLLRAAARPATVAKQKNSFFFALSLSLSLSFSVLSPSPQQRSPPATPRFCRSTRSWRRRRPTSRLRSDEVGVENEGKEKKSEFFVEAVELLFF